MAFSELLPLAVALLGGGVVAGIIAGLFGVGGGAVLVPVLYQLFSAIGIDDAVRMHIAVGTSLAIIVPTSIRSFLSHAKRDGVVDMAFLKNIALPVLAGVGLGSLAAAHVPADGLKAVFAVLALLMAVKMYLGKQDWRLGEDLPGPAGLAGYGLGIGFFSTLMGIGGGVFGNTLMTLHGRSMHQAVATSSGLGVLISIPGMIGFMAAGWNASGLPPFSLGYVSLIGVALVIPASILAAPLGVKLAHALPRRTLELAFAVFLTFVAFRFFYALW
ncbi:MAG TPA: sulfite exporter TauE/SafE family protein [Rhodobacteraceae bacterium]|nr:sulfite exporter TauE/SafE family protein [Paracoccaceae bacterium]